MDANIVNEGLEGEGRVSAFRGPISINLPASLVDFGQLSAQLSGSEGGGDAAQAVGDASNPHEGVSLQEKLDRRRIARAAEKHPDLIIVDVRV